MEELKTLDNMMLEYERMGTSDRLAFLRWLYRVDRHKYEYCQLDEATRQWYGADGQRGI